MPTGRPVEVTRTKLSALEFRRVAARSRDADAARRMLTPALVLVLVLEGKSRKEAAESCGMDRQILRDWVVRGNDKGLPGLSARAPPGPTFRLAPEQMAELTTIVEAGPDPAADHVVRWRCVDLRRVIAATRARGRVNVYHPWYKLEPALIGWVRDGPSGRRTEGRPSSLRVSLAACSS